MAACPECYNLAAKPVTDTKEEIMEAFTFPFMVLIFCVVILSAVSIYFPTIYIRKTNKLLALLEKIENNTRK